MARAHTPFKKFTISGDKPANYAPATKSVDPEKRRSVEEHQHRIREREDYFSFEHRETAFASRRQEGSRY